MGREISNSDDVIDSRDVIKRIDELEGELQTMYDLYCEGKAEIEETPLTKDQWLELEEFDDAELTALQALRDEADGSPDWKYGETLIRASYFREYAMQLADDIGAINADATWPNNCIDWDRAARELQMDYTAVDFDGVEYFIRS